MEKRFKACVAWGAIWDYYATWKKRIDQRFKTELSVPGHHIEWILNAKNLGDALEKLEGFRLDGVVHNEGILRDWQAQTEFWQRHAGPVRQVGTRVNDAYLKSQGQTEGLRSYGMMVDLLIAEWRKGR